MDEQPKRYRQILVWLCLPPALIIMVPVVVFFAFALYLRAAAIGVAMLVRVALKHKSASVAATQGPHLLRVNVGVKKAQ
jgi:hypothetical protein